jgi:hypothetical protein
MASFRAEDSPARSTTLLFSFSLFLVSSGRKSKEHAVSDELSEVGMHCSFFPDIPVLFLESEKTRRTNLP